MQGRQSARFQDSARPAPNARGSDRTHAFNRLSGVLSERRAVAVLDPGRKLRIDKAGCHRRFHNDTGACVDSTFPGFLFMVPRDSTAFCNDSVTATGRCRSTPRQPMKS